MGTHLPWWPSGRVLAARPDGTCFEARLIGGYGGDWSRIRARVLAEEPLCVGYPIGCHEDGPPVRTTVVDHIKPIVDGGTRARRNLRGLCTACNSRKGQHEGDRAFPKRSWRDS